MRRNAYDTNIRGRYPARASSEILFELSVVWGYVLPPGIRDARSTEAPDVISPPVREFFKKKNYIYICEYFVFNFNFKSFCTARGVFLRTITGAPRVPRTVFARQISRHGKMPLFSPFPPIKSAREIA